MSNNWDDNFLDHMKTAPVTPKKRKPSRSPQQMIDDALAHFKALNLPGIEVNESPNKKIWAIVFHGDCERYKDILIAHGARRSMGTWYYTASKRKRS